MASYGGVRFKQRLARTVLPHQPYSTDLAMSNLETSKMPSTGKRFGDEEKVIEETSKWMRIKIRTGTRRGKMPLFLAGARLSILMEII